MSYAVQLEQVEPRPMASVRRLTGKSQLSVVIPDGLGDVWRFIKSSGVAHLGLDVALYHDLAMNVECGVLLPGPFAASGDVAAPRRPAARWRHGPHRPVHRLGDVHQAILDWCSAGGHRVAGPFWELYDHWIYDLSKLRTDVYYLLAGRPPRSNRLRASSMLGGSIFSTRPSASMA